ncbi:MAG TPA: VWA domain-containing protein [Acidobacteriaceae bacterium]|nr:VWA domain-containing protein [Acidobacteriaceae bacterium]
MKGKGQWVLGMLLGWTLSGSVWAQGTPAPPPPAKPPATTDDSGPATTNDSIVLPKKKDDADTPPPPPAPAEEKPKNPNGDIYSLRVDVPIVNLDVGVLLDKTHQFVPGLKPDNFLVVEDGVEQQVQTVRTTKTPITAVMLLEFAANSYWLINDMENASAAFFRTLQPEDYVAVETYDIKPHILCDFTNNREVVAQALQSLMIPTWHETNEFDALYETLDRLSRVEGQKYIILISSGVDTMSKLTLDQMLAKVKASQNITIFSIATGGMAQEMRSGGGPREMTYLQAENELRTFAQMTGGMYFQPIFQGEMPDIFSRINDSIRNKYVLTYRPTNNKNDGSYRKVKVYLVDNEGKPLKMADEKGKPLKYSVIARDGYRAKLPVE